jgi:hypothetical protein
MKLSWFAVVVILLLIALGVLGHTVWHTQVVTVFNFLTELFTGAHVVG